MLVASALVLSQCPGQERGELFEGVYDTLRERFHDARFRSTTLPRLVTAFRSAAQAAESDAEERAVVHAFLAEIPASHLALYSKATYRHLMAELANQPAATFGCEVVALGSRFFVNDVLEGSPAAEAGLLRGDQVLAIDLVPCCSSPRLDWRSDDAALPDPPLHRLLCTVGDRAVGDTTLLRVASQPGKERLVQLTARKHSAFLAARASIRSIEIEGRQYGYLRLRFLHTSGVPQLVQQALTQKFADCAGVVIDLRGRGGSAATAPALARMLARRDPKLPLAFLIDAQTRSAKEAFALEVRKRELGVLVGERTAGALLPASFAAINAEAVLMYPASGLGELTREIEGRGVAPDVEVSATPLPYAAGADAILAAGLRELQRATAGAAYR